jgi:hypothetical protein
MRRLLLLLALLGAPAGAQNPCYADFKASRGAPLELLYGVSEVRGECAPGPAAAEIASRIAVDGWQLLEVTSTFGPEGLEARRASAGEYFLRY